MSRHNCWRALRELYQTRSGRLLAAVGAMALSAFYVVVAFSAFDATPYALAQESPLPTPQLESFAPTTTIYLPIIMMPYSAPELPIVALGCGDDPERGSIYRSLVSNTIVIMNPLAGWAASGCQCGQLDAQARGYAIGTIAGMMLRIVGQVLIVLGSMISSAVQLLLQIIGVMQSPASSVDVSCEADMQGFCIALAAMIALDENAGGIITTLVTLLVSLLSFYLILYVVREVREIMQPSGGDAE